MNDSAAATATPRHLWITGIASLLWSAFGAYDHVMTNIRDPGYLSQFAPESVQMFDSFPVWVMVAWACGVWGAVAGAVLLLLRSRHAVHAFALSLAGLAVNTVYQLAGGVPDAMATSGMMAMNALIWAAAVLLAWYAIRQRKTGVLR